MNTFYLSSTEIEKAVAIYREYFPERVEQLFETADNACRNRFKVPFTMVADQWIDMGDPVNWLANPTNDYEFTWVFNRHYHLIDLGKAYLLSKDVKYARVFKRQIHDWIRQNPVPNGLSYREGSFFQLKSPWRILEAGLRAQSWIWAYHLMQDSAEIDAGFIGELFGSLYEHADFLSFYIGDPNINHAIMEMQGLFMIGLLCREHSRADYWVELAKERIELCMHRQVGSDGIQIERSVFYHNECIKLFCEPYILGRKTGNPFPEWFEAKLRQMGEFSLAVTRPDGKATPSSDSDCERSDRILGLLGATLADEYFCEGGTANEDVLWTLGVEAFKKSALGIGPPNPSPPEFKAFPDTGFYILRDQKQYLFFSAAKINAPHGHADLLHFEWMRDRQLIFSDPGRYTYEEGQLRQYFKGTRGHNTIVIDGLDQTPYISTQAWGEPVAQPLVHRWETGRAFDFIDASHDGYHRLEQPVTHRRWLFLAKKMDFLLVMDWLEGQGTHQMEQRLNLSPLGKVEPVEDARIWENEVKVTFGNYGEDLLINRWLTKDGENPEFGVERGWFSERYGFKDEMPVLVTKCRFQNRVCLMTLCRPLAHQKLFSEIIMEGVNINLKPPEVFLLLNDGGRQYYLKIDSDSIRMDSMEAHE